MRLAFVFLDLRFRFAFLRADATASTSLGVADACGSAIVVANKKYRKTSLRIFVDSLTIVTQSCG